jgi:hypothetical protein
MIHAPIMPGPGLPACSGLVLAAARCWRLARDEGRPVQRSLYRLLRPLDLGMLAPVFDGLMSMSEAALGRRIGVNRSPALSTDEQILLELLDGSRARRASLGCRASLSSALDCAISATRVMIALALSERERGKAR